MDRLSSEPGLRALFSWLGPRADIPVCLDSPLGLELTKIYSRLRPFWDREAREILQSGDDPLDFEHLYGVGKFQDHLRLLEMPGPAVILAGSGMCTGGRIVNHLKLLTRCPKNRRGSSWSMGMTRPAEPLRKGSSVKTLLDLSVL